MLKKDKTKPFREMNPDGPTGPTAEEMVMHCAVSKLKADRTPIPDNRFTLPPEYGVAGGAPKIIDGHEYVDLGLPSGILWAKMNVGAESETDYGLYFAWGETQGYADTSTKAFSWSDYKFNPSGDGSTFTKYNTDDGYVSLEAEDDAVNVNWGGGWHMPEPAECNELFNSDYVTNQWITNYNNSNVNGCLFTSVSNGNTLFIPAAGWCYDGNTSNGSGRKADCWTNECQGSDLATRFGADNRGYTYTLGYQRYGGYPVRGVHLPTDYDPSAK